MRAADCVFKAILLVGMCHSLELKGCPLSVSTSLGFLQREIALLGD